MSTALPEFRNHPLLDFSKRQVGEEFQEGLVSMRASFPREAPLVIHGRRHETEEKIESRCPSEESLLCGTSASATEQQVDSAVRSAREAFADWARTTPEERAAVLLRASRIMKNRFVTFAAMMVFEAGKPWREADADVAEAIDFLEFYAREMMAIGGETRLQPYLLGERNNLTYHPLGVVGVICPWNFPMAIPVGMSSAAIVAGNTVLLKPAEQTPLIMSLFVKVMEEAGLPSGVLNFLPGRGEVCGARIVRHPDVNMIVFTGSREVGLKIIREAGEVAENQHFVKRVVTEMGGKNAIIVDSSADIDSSVPDVVQSAFGFAGQKCSACSRLILMKDIYDDYLKRLKEAVASQKIGPAHLPGTQVGPVIDRDAEQKIRGYIDHGKKNARLVYAGNVEELAREGPFVEPAIFEVKTADHRLAQEEIFGPVLTVLKARNYDEALKIANSTPYALTGGVHSRTVSHLQRARREFEAGNLYLNRTITGAIVGRQPFGGYRLSGIGSKAGGPDYLRQFLLARVVTENTMRHGIASLEEG